MNCGRKSSGTTGRWRAPSTSRAFRDEQGGEVSGLTVGDVLSQYITTFDKGLKAYFDCLQQDDVTREGVIAELEDIYSKYLQGEVQL